MNNTNLGLQESENNTAQQAKRNRVCSDTLEIFILDNKSYEQNSDDSEESSFSEPIFLKRKIKKKSISQFQNGHWSLEEHLKYLEFMKSDYGFYSGQVSNKVFKHMSNFVLTRSPAQCRSHHQKFNTSTHIQRNHRLNRILGDPQSVNKPDVYTFEQPVLLKYSDNEDIPNDNEDYFI